MQTQAANPAKGRNLELKSPCGSKCTYPPFCRPRFHSSSLPKQKMEPEILPQFPFQRGGCVPLQLPSSLEAAARTRLAASQRLLGEALEAQMQRQL